MELSEFISQRNPDHKRILVTAPQRAGTTIAAKMIAEITGYPYCDEDGIVIDDLTKFFTFHFESHSYVLQAPGLSFIAHRLPVDLVVFMHRDIDDIAKSEQRINWHSQWNNYETDKYFYDGNLNNARRIKYEVWNKFQKPFMEKHNKQYIDLDYESLKSHPLWIDKTSRKNFKPRQTE